MGKLNARKVAALAKDDPRKTADGNGLYFVVPASGEPFWILRFSMNGSRPEMTLGSYPELSLADARDAAFQQRKLIQQGINPLAERQRLQTGIFWQKLSIPLLMLPPRFRDSLKRTVA